MSRLTIFLLWLCLITASIVALLGFCYLGVVILDAFGITHILY